MNCCFTLQGLHKRHEVCQKKLSVEFSWFY